MSSRKPIVNILCAASTFVHFFKKDSLSQSLSVSYTLIGMNKLFSLSPHIWKCIGKKSDSPVHTVFTNVMSITILNFFNILYLVVLLLFAKLKKYVVFILKKNLGSRVFLYRP